VTKTVAYYLLLLITAVKYFTVKVKCQFNKTLWFKIPMARTVNVLQS